jgi:dTDP-4-dehydro-6-deoxy-alpha-D-glucopyranose 2,3-dehydratase
VEKEGKKMENQSWKKWLEEQQNKSKMSITPINLGEVKGWEMDPESVRRPDRGFFELIGVNIAPTAQREVSSWDQPMLKEAGEGIVVLVCSHVLDTSGSVLLQAKAEPGNDSLGRVLLVPTLQTSKSNLEAAHGGKKPARSDLINDQVKWFSFCQDGGRYFNKRNNYAIVEVDDFDVEPAANERWFSLFELVQAITDGCVNEHLLQVFALMVAQRAFDE